MDEKGIAQAEAAPSYGEQMAEVHNKWHRCEPLTDEEVKALVKWVEDVADYLRNMRQGWPAVYLYGEKESLDRIIEARKRY